MKSSSDRRGSPGKLRADHFLMPKLLHSRFCQLSAPLVLALVACNQEPGPRSSASVERPGASAANASPAPLDAAAAHERPAFVTPYPRGRWRLAPASALAQTVLWPSQILIRHADVRNEVSFNLAQWFSVPPPSSRSREEALALAQQVAREAARAPDRFPELARQYSEDLARREEGGAFGAISAAHLDSWPQVLDALAALRPGETSEVVETRYGFHIFRREAPPPEASLSGAHIVIAHDAAQWIAFFARDTPPIRSREAAWQRAQDIYRTARAEPGRFAELVQQFSDHRDALVGGDVGAWSTREPSAYPMRHWRLAELSVGEVGAPIETHLGFEIVQRTAPRERARYRARIFAPQTEISSEVPRLDATAREQAFLAASTQALEFIREPQRFAALGERAFVLQWEEGRDNASLSAAFQTLPVGALTKVPVASEWGFIIAQRLDPESEAPVQYSTELPDPNEPDLFKFADALSPEGTQAFLSDLATDVQRELRLDAADAERLLRLHEVAGPLELASAETRFAALARVIDGCRSLLNAERFANYRAAFNRNVSTAILTAPLVRAQVEGL
jgi:hypothetical protein